MVQSFTELSKMIDGIMTGTIGLIWAVLIVGFIVATLGMINTLCMNVLERVREFALLRAIGMTDNRIVRSVLLEAFLMGVLGILPGAVFGCLLALGINMSTQALFGHIVEFRLHVSMLLGFIIAALGIVTLAGWIPARMAIGTPITEAIHYE